MKTIRHIAIIAPLLLLLMGVSGCKEEEAPQPNVINEGSAEATPGDGERQFSFSPRRVSALLSSPGAVIRLQAKTPFTVAGFVWEGTPPEVLEARALLESGAWTGWRSPVVTLDQSDMFNGYLDFNAPARALEFRRKGGLGTLVSVYVEFHE